MTLIRGGVCWRGWNRVATLIQDSPAKPAIAELTGNGPKQAVYSKDFDCRNGVAIFHF